MRNLTRIKGRRRALQLAVVGVELGRTRVPSYLAHPLGYWDAFGVHPVGVGLLEVGLTTIGVHQKLIAVCANPDQPERSPAEGEESSACFRIYHCLTALDKCHAVICKLVKLRPDEALRLEKRYQFRDEDQRLGDPRVLAKRPDQGRTGVDVLLASILVARGDHRDHGRGGLGELGTEIGPSAREPLHQRQLYLRRSLS